MNCNSVDFSGKMTPIYKCPKTLTLYLWKSRYKTDDVIRYGFDHKIKHGLLDIKV